jgi:hypothetical protein
MKLFIRKLRWLLPFAFASLFLQACDNDNDPVVQPPPPPPPPAMASFDVTVTNLTNAQPLSPVAVVAHQSGYSMFAVGSPSTTGFEEMAEGGDNTALLAEADADPAVTASASGAAPIPPAGSETITVELLNAERLGLQLSVSTMLVNTNDAITGVASVAVETMAVGDSVTIRGVAYDAGTEANSEAATDIPGPAGGGEGYNAARDDRADQVSMHAGVVSGDDGFATSDLTEQHRFDNPVADIRITRTE